jgi:nucleoside-diphosphate-sugar epimerase
VHYFVTGGTGLIGRELVPHLLRRGAVTLLVRSEAKKRWAELFAEWRKLGELKLVDGDVAVPNLGMRDVNLACDHVFHLAGLYDLEADPQQLERVNAGGTRNVIAALRKSGFSGTLHHFSSVAVAGDFSGTMEEDRLDVGQTHRHPYHQSKFDAEKMVRDLEDIRFRIYRPTAVVGHSKTGAMDRIDGPYFLFEAVYKLRETLPRWMPLMAYEGATVNMAPVDWVASAIDRIAHAPGQDRKTFHLVDPNPPHFVDTFNMIADAAGAPRLPKKKGMLRRLLPGVGDVTGKLGSAQFLRSRMMEDFGIPRSVQVAVNKDVTFDTKNTDAVLGSKLRVPPQEQYVEALWDYYKKNLASARNKDVRNKKFFSGKKVLITGASSGIGESMAKKLAGAGAEVILVARRDAELAEVAEGIRAQGGKADWVRADLSDLEECDRVVRTVLEKHGWVDVLVNNAGHSIRTSRCIRCQPGGDQIICGRFYGHRKRITTSRQFAAIDREVEGTPVDFDAV